MGNRPVGIFDSGLGGISVFRAVRRLLPREDYIYYGDSANAPYGTKPEAEIRRLALEVADRLIGMDCRALVIACNTATQAALATLQAAHPGVPIVGTTPAVEKAVALAPGGVVWVMATPATIRSARLRAIMARCDGKATLLPLDCPGLMEFVERGELTGERLRSYLVERFAGLPTPDVIVLGCTHYPFVSPMIRAVVGEAPKIIDAADDVALELQRQLAALGASQATGDGRVTWLNSLNTADIIGRSKALFGLP